MRTESTKITLTPSQGSNNGLFEKLRGSGTVEKRAEFWAGETETRGFEDRDKVLWVDEKLQTCGSPEIWLNGLSVSLTVSGCI